MELLTNIKTYGELRESGAWRREQKALFEPDYFNGSKEVLYIFSQKCVICFERDSVYAFRRCEHQCKCESCYEKRGNIDILKYINCRT